MLHVIDDLVPMEQLPALSKLCESHGVLKDRRDGDSLFSWYATDAETMRSVHTTANQELMGRYLNDYLLPVIMSFASEHTGIEWWCNTNNDLDWHIDKDESVYRSTGRHDLPLLSTVFYPHISCAGGELLLAHHPAVAQGSSQPMPTFQSVISIPPVINRLVLFSPGLLHRINPFEGERYSIAANIWGHALQN